MADVTGPDGARRRVKGHGQYRDRGQLILVGGVVVAFALVALVLLLNSALFTENIATRGVDPSIERAGDHVAVTRRAGRGVVRSLESVEYRTWSAADAAVRANISIVSVQVRRVHLERYGSYVAIEVSNTHEGAVIVQENVTRNFSSAGGAERWNLTRTSGIRNFTMTVNRSRTANASRNRAFNLTVAGDSGSTWTAFVNATTTDIRLSVPSRTGLCSKTASNATINWTDGTFGGSCAFTFAAGLDPPYVVRFNNSDNASGTYHLVVGNTSGDEVFDGNLHDVGSARSPRQHPGVYSLLLEVLYEDSATEYDSTVRVAPGEPPQTSPP